MRHARSEANSRGILASQKDFPLTEEGKLQAALIAGRFKALLEASGGGIDHILSSPLSRARQTAAPFMELFGLPLETNDLIIEQHLGKYSGMSYEELDHQPDYMHDRLKRWDWVPSGGGESYRMMAERVGRFFDTLEEGSWLIVAHAVTMRLMHAVLTCTLPSYPEWIPSNGDIWEVDFDAVGTTHEITIHHLAPELDTTSKA